MRKELRNKYPQPRRNPFDRVPVSINVAFDLHGRALLIHDVGMDQNAIFSKGLTVLCIIEKAQENRSYISVDVSSLLPHEQDDTRIYLFALARRLLRKWRREAVERSEAARTLKYARVRRIRKGDQTW